VSDEESSGVGPYPPPEQEYEEDGDENGEGQRDDRYYDNLDTEAGEEREYEDEEELEEAKQARIMELVEKGANVREILVEHFVGWSN